MVKPTSRLINVLQEEQPATDITGGLFWITMQCLPKKVVETTTKDPELNTLFIGALANTDRSAQTTTVHVPGAL